MELKSYAHIQATRAIIMRTVPLLGVLAALALVLSCPPTAHAANRVSVQLNELHSYFTNEDSVASEPLAWSHEWHPLIGNLLDGGGPVMNPTIYLWTTLPVDDFSPDDPSIFTAQPPLYTWDFDGLNVEEPAQLGVQAFMEGPVTATPPFSAARSVVPVTLVADETLQDITVTFTLNEPFPPQVNWFMLSIGHPVLAYGYDYPIGGGFVSQNPVGSLTYGTDGVQAWWYGDPSSLAVGTYEFEATLKSTKLEGFAGSPMFKPGVAIQWGEMNVGTPVTSTTVTITHPTYPASATFIADNEVDWEPASRTNYFVLWLNPVISLDVVVPADVIIEPQTLNLGSKGVLTAFIRLPQPYSPADVAMDTVRCQGVTAKRISRQGDVILCKFDRQQLQDLLPGKGVELTVTGQLADGLTFAGSDTITVTDPGRK